VSRWRAHLAAIRTADATAISADSVDSPAHEPIGAFGTSGIRTETAKTPAADRITARIAFYTRFQAEASAALAASDPDLDPERAVMAEHYAAPTAHDPDHRQETDS
jgi:hypothetical protein